MCLRPKFAILLVVMFSLLAFTISALQDKWLTKLVIDHTSQRMKQNIQSGWQILNDRLVQLEVSVALLVEKQAVQRLAGRSKTEQDHLLEPYRHQLNLDLLLVLSSNDRKVEMLNLNSALPTPDSNGVRSGFALVDEDIFNLSKLEGTASSTTMILYAAVATQSDANGKFSYLVAIENLKGAFSMVESIQGALFEDRFYEGARIGTVTIFMGPERIATTVLRENGDRAIGTVVSDEVARQTLQNGVPWTGRAWVVNDWYLSQYDPIRDVSGAIIGMLYIGELEKVLLDTKRQTLWTSISVVFAVMAFALLLSYVVSMRVLRQIEELDTATLRFADGDLSTRVKITTHDEIGDLAASFNAMAALIEKDQNQLREQKAEIERINANYMEMLGFVTHELRSTVSSALLNTGLLKDGSYGALHDDQREGIEHVENSLLYLSELTNNYLQLSRIEKGELIVNKSDVNVKRDVIDPVMQALSQQMKSRGMTIDCQIDDHLQLPADVNLLRVVYENLIGNAIKFGKEGGLIVLHGEVTEAGIQLTVFNEGKGIDEQRLTVLFKKFERYDVDERSGKQGSGLGLFIVQQILAVHGGDIRVESVSQHGTMFTINLPL
jgi:signal transduction histidine kinase